MRIALELSTHGQSLLTPFFTGIDLSKPVKQRYSCVHGVWKVSVSYESYYLGHYPVIFFYDPEGGAHRPSRTISYYILGKTFLIAAKTYEDIMLLIAFDPLYLAELDLRFDGRCIILK